MLKHTWPSAARLTKDNIAFVMEFLLGRSPADERELNIAAHIAFRFPAPRLELFRNVTSLPTFVSGNRDFHAVLFDQMLRRRVFDGVRPPKVSVFCVGAPRCGTTTLSAIAAQHREVYPCPIKETNFFSHMSNLAAPNGVSLDMYEMFYFGWDSQPILTDFSPNYLRYRHAIDGIHEYNPDAKIIVCLRNPVDRAISNFFYLIANHNSDNAFDFFSAGIADFMVDLPSSEPWFSAKTILRQGLYYTDLRYLKEHFKKVLIIEFSEFANLRALYSKLCTFMEIAPDEERILSQYDKPLNASKKQDNSSVQGARELLLNFYSDDVRSVENNFGVRFAN
jgi:hypothetical protein